MSGGMGLPGMGVLLRDVRMWFWYLGGLFVFASCLSCCLGCGVFSSGDSGPGFHAAFIAMGCFFWVVVGLLMQGVTWLVLAVIRGLIFLAARLFGGVVRF